MGTTMMKRHDLSIFVAISLILHALFFSFLLQWARSTVQAKPQYDNISVSLVPGSPQVNTAAKQASSPRPLRGPQPVVLPKPMPEKPIVQEKKPAAPQQEPIPTSPSTVQDSTDGGVRGGMGTSGTTIGQGSPGGVPAVNAAAGDTVNAERAFANARDAYVMELYAIINKHFVYPTLARKRGQEGKVQLRFVIGDDGRAENIEMVSSSGYYLLDRAAMETIRLIPLPRPPRHAMQVPVTIVYRLEDAP